MGLWMDCGASSMSKTEIQTWQIGDTLVIRQPSGLVAIDSMSYGFNGRFESRSDLQQFIDELTQVRDKAFEDEEPDLGWQAQTAWLASDFRTEFKFFATGAIWQTWKAGWIAAKGG